MSDAPHFDRLDRESLRRMFEAPPDASLRVDKVVPLEAALRAHVRPGMTLHFAYSEGRPMAIGNALVRCFAGTDPGFTISSAGLVGHQAAFVTEGLARRLEVSFVGENYPTPTPNRILQQAIDSGAVEIENQSLLVLYQRLAAGAFGFPFALTRSWIGSSFERNASFARVVDPFGGGEVGAVRALVPDVTFVHGLAADRQGNILLSPPFGEGEIGAFAARRGVVATVERIVSSDVIRRNATLARIPAHRVLSVSEAPLGCHPYAIYNPGGIEVPDYVEDYESFAEVRRAGGSLDAYREWTREWILGVDGHEGYLRKLGAERVNALRGRATPEAWQDDLLPALERIANVKGHDATEAMVTAAAAVLVRKVRDDGFAIVEAGVGYANLAAWLAVTKLQVDDGLPAELVAEIGLYGYLPKPGEPFIFSNRNLSTCKSMSGVEAILGLYVGGRHNDCVAIIGAGQIDAAGNINSTYGNDGRFLVGSGGANDIASGARDVIAVTKQSKQRLVAKLPYVTSPGANVSTLVTDLGVFEKRDGQLVLTCYQRADGEDAQRRVESIRARCGWPLTVADDLRPCDPPAAADLLRLRLYDPRGDFLGHTSGAGKVEQ
jgi:acyl CoA:acetate/3-ketoacid CoA transferase alpha subunit/acyl CoA:acetate/3-ketoacid CoA transferase beta subunit